MEYLNFTAMNFAAANGKICCCVCVLCMTGAVVLSHIIMWVQVRYSAPECYCAMALMHPTAQAGTAVVIFRTSYSMETGENV